MSEELKEPAQLREAYDKLQKEVVPKLESQVETLTKENRTLRVEGLFTSPEVGLTAQQARLYPGDAELTVDAVKAFAEEFGLTPAQASGGGSPDGGSSEAQDTSAQGDDASQSGDLSLIGRAGSSSGAGGQPTPGKEKMSTTDWFALKEKDPAAAEKARAEGRVELREDNFYLKAGKVRQN